MSYDRSRIYKFVTKHLKDTAKAALGRNLKGRRITVLDDDVFITSYPKSGNTWMRFLIAHLLWPDGSTRFANIEQKIPDIYRYWDAYLLRARQPRFLKSHEYFHPKYPKVLYIVRDVRSVIISYYHYLERRGEIEPGVTYYDFAKSIASGEIWPCSWRDHVLSWIRLRGVDHRRFLLIRYEDIHRDGVIQLQRVSRFLGINSAESSIKNAIELSSFNRMQENEKEDGKKWAEAERAKKASIPFMRCGKTSEWKDVLDGGTLSFINNTWGQLLTELGYEI